jgi:hypothetical protein
MSYAILRAHINEKRKSLDSKTERGNYSHHHTTLNNIVKLGLSSEDNIQHSLTADLDDLINQYREFLKAKNRSDTKSPLTRVRRLSDLYRELISVETDGLTFTDIIQHALKNLYGDKIFIGEITPNTQKVIKKNSLTYREIATNMILKSKEVDENLWPQVKLDETDKYNKVKGLSSASKVLRDYFDGEAVPTERISNERINFIEEQLGLPKNTLINKIVRKTKSYYKREKKRTNPKSTKSKRYEVISNSLSKGLQLCFDEYSNFKIRGHEPEIRNITESTKKCSKTLKRLRVKEITKRHNKSWTNDGKGANGSAICFYNHLIFFQDYCVRHEKIKLEDVSTKHLTDPKLLNRMVKYIKLKGHGGTSPARLINFVNIGAQNKGYLRLCGERGERTIEDYYDDLDFILEDYHELKSSCMFAVSSRGEGSQKGKKNIKFILDEPADNRQILVHQSCTYLITQAISFQAESKRNEKLAINAKTQLIREKRSASAASYIRKAYKRIITALISEVSWIVVPRASTWGIFKYYPSISQRDDEYSSITYLKKENRYEMKAPLYGPSLLDPNVKVRYLKNSDAINATEISLKLPEYLSPLFSKFLSIRNDYIKLDLGYHIKELVENCNLDIQKIETELKSITNEDSRLIKEIEVNELKLDLSAFRNFDINEVETLLPYRSIRNGETKTKNLVRNPRWRNNRAMHRNMLFPPKNIGEIFRGTTEKAFIEVHPDLIQEGINIHAMRHLIAETHLELNPGDFIGAAAKLNDEIEQIIKTYGNRDRSKVMRELGNIQADFKY